MSKYGIMVDPIKVEAIIKLVSPAQFTPAPKSSIEG